MSFERIARTSLVWYVLAAFFSAGAQEAPPASSPAAAPWQWPELRERWLGCLAEFGVPGFAIVAIRDDEVAFIDAFGHRDAERKLPVTPDTAFYIASSTKPFTAMGVLTLVEAGKIGLDDPVKKHLPRLKLRDEDLTDTLTVRDLLCHRHGLNSEPIVLLDAYTGEITEDRFYHFLPTAEIAGKASYSNLHFTLVGRVIEAASGKPWRDYLAQAIFKPAGMSSATGYATEMYRREDVALPYALAAEEGFRPAPRKSDETMHAAGGLGMSIRDLGRWLRLNIGGGEIDGRRVLGSALAGEMIKQQADVEPQGRIRRVTGIGLGWQVGTYRGRPYALHKGGYFGSASHVSFLPEQRLGVAVVANGSGGAGLFIDQVVSIDVLDCLLGERNKDLLPSLRQEAAKHLPELRKQAGRPEVDFSKADMFSRPLKEYAGEYVEEHFGKLTVAYEGGKLTCRLGLLALPVRAVKTDALMLEFDDEERECQFEIEGDRVRAATIALSGGPVRFVRR